MVAYSINIDRTSGWKRPMPLPARLVPENGMLMAPSCDTSSSGYWPLTSFSFADFSVSASLVTSAFAFSMSLTSSCAPTSAASAPLARSAPPPAVNPMAPPMSAVIAASTATFLRPLRRASITSSPSSTRIACGARAGAAAAGATAPNGFAASAAGAAAGGRLVNGGAGTPEGDTGRGELVYVGAGMGAGAAAAGATPAPTGGGTVEPPAATGALMGELIVFLPRRALRSILGFCSVIGALRGAEKSPIVPAVPRRRPAQ